MPLCWLLSTQAYTDKKTSRFNVRVPREVPVLWLVVAAHVRAPQLLNQDPNDADKQDEVDLGDRGRKNNRTIRLIEESENTH